VAGTNGKGSTVACLEAIWRAAGRRTGAFTSPHLIRFNERIRIDGMDATDEQILSALDQVTPHIAPDTLTYFEAAALAAMVCFQEAGCDAIVLEVGLGGRLDATNLWDADGAILSGSGRRTQSSGGRGAGHSLAARDFSCGVCGPW